MAEFNQGYEIVAKEVYHHRTVTRDDLIVLGKEETRLGTQWVTWEGSTDPLGRTDYFWGHYFDNEAQARADYHRRLAEHYSPSDDG